MLSQEDGHAVKLSDRPNDINRRLTFQCLSTVSSIKFEFTGNKSSPAENVKPIVSKFTQSVRVDRRGNQRIQIERAFVEAQS